MKLASAGGCIALQGAARRGVLCRVLQPGDVQAGDAIEIEPSAYERIPLTEVVHTRFVDSNNIAAIERILSNPALAAVWRRDFEGLLTRANRSA